MRSDALVGRDEVPGGVFDDLAAVVHVFCGVIEDGECIGREAERFGEQGYEFIAQVDELVEICEHRGFEAWDIFFIRPLY